MAMSDRNRPQRQTGSSRRPADPMNVTTGGLEGWTMAIVAGGASILGVVGFVYLLSGLNLMTTAFFAIDIGIFLVFSLVVMYLTGAL